MRFRSDGFHLLSTVRKIICGIDPLDQHPVDANSLFRCWILNLAKQFPETEDLDVRVTSKWTSISLADICQAFPKLKSLRVESSGGKTMFLSETCTVEPKPHDYLGRRDERINQEILHALSYLHVKNLKMLKSLDLSCIEISSEAFQYCLPRMADLKDLTFTYRPGPTVEVLADGLKHVKNLTIYSEGGASQEDPTLLALLEALPCSDIIIKK